MARLARIDSQIRADRVILANHFIPKVPELNPLVVRIAFRGTNKLRIAGWKRFARTASNVFFFSANRFARIAPIRVVNRQAI